jgi:hypothetical protein
MTMKIDADEKDLLESIERGEWKSVGGGKRERSRYARCQGDVSQGSAAEYSSVEQGPGGDSEACARGRRAVPDADLEPAHKYASGRLKEV